MRESRNSTRNLDVLDTLGRMQVGLAADSIRYVLTQWDDTTTADTIYVKYVEKDSGNVTDAGATSAIMEVNTANNTIKWADGNKSFDNIWNNRAALTYTETSQ